MPLPPRALLETAVAKIEARVGVSRNSVSREVRRVATPFAREGWLTHSQLCSVLKMWLVGVPPEQLESFCIEFVGEQLGLSVDQLVAEIAGKPTKTRVHSSPPKDERFGLELARVFGYSGNALECSGKSFVYAAAGGSVIAVVGFSKQAKTYDYYYCGHSAAAQITAISVRNQLAASADNAGVIQLWSVNGAATAKVLGDGLFKSVNVLALNKSSKILLAAGRRTGGSTVVVVCFFDCASSQLLAEDEVTCDGGVIRAAAACDASSFVTVGDGHVSFWRTSQGYLENVTPGQFRCATASSYGSVTVIDRDDQRAAQVVLVGADNGRIYVFRDGACLTTILAHSGSVTALFSDGEGVFSGGNDGKVKAWSKKLTTLESEWSLGTSVAALRRRNNDSAIIASTSSGSIVSCGESSKVTRIGGGHLGTARAVAAHPLDPEVFATTGDDRRVIVWTVSGERTRTAKLEAAGSALAYEERPADAFGIVVVDALVVGCVEGDVLVLDPNDLSTKKRYKENAAITALRLCEAGLLVAVANGEIKLFQSRGLSCTLKGHQAPVKYMDISDGDDDEETLVLRSHDAERQTLYWVLDAHYSRRLSAVKKSRRWRTWTEGGKSRTRDGKLLARASPFRLDQSKPSNKKTSSSSPKLVGVRQPSHHHMVAVVFLADDRHLVAIRRDDRSVMVWKVASDIDEGS